MQPVPGPRPLDLVSELVGRCTVCHVFEIVCHLMNQRAHRPAWREVYVPGAEDIEAENRATRWRVIVGIQPLDRSNRHRPQAGSSLEPLGPAAFDIVGRGLSAPTNGCSV